MLLHDTNMMGKNFLIQCPVQFCLIIATIQFIFLQAGLFYTVLDSPYVSDVQFFFVTSGYSAASFVVYTNTISRRLKHYRRKPHAAAKLALSFGHSKNHESLFTLRNLVVFLVSVSGAARKREPGRENGNFPRQKT